MAVHQTLGSGGLGNTDEGTGGRLATVLVVISLVLFTLSAQEGGSGVLSTIRSGFSVVAMPFEAAGSLVAAPFRGIGNIFVNLTADQETLTELEDENAKLKAENAQLAEEATDAQSLRSLLELQDQYNLESTGANVIAGSTDSWSSTLTIDKGTSSGLTVGMPVCDANGVIGQIIECGPTSSVVRLMSDESSAISAMVQTSRARGTLRGSADGTVYLTTIAVSEDVSVGDMVVTSGLGGVFPKGLPLGTVSSVERPEGAVSYTITVEPITQTTPEQVLVITSITQEQQADASDDASADTAASTDSATADSSADTQS
ncbi:MAG: rod shape-determining protein MreC [Atopobiaceae bacterium]|jgi:rod shape-determining protein MreC|nr:rod shape-determining protein MreC [Atopobiaceae bacterium]MCH4119213.1 rod shape-determining protein MreC [Atopobiaceae bacterium]MCI1318006.1 rod shape-determining protein MreC [Atopobiaceae bacterium]MCI1388527.1 rod shape-determining protein MreC [Atopobiaceae bacterium]MCI1432026.1 rod shape-determining protein MreC [Atopobiaceae bacterium]